MISSNSALRLFLYCKSTAFIEASSVRHGIIRSRVFFFTKSIVGRSSTSSIATSSAPGSFLNATILFVRAIGSGISESVSKSIFSLARFTNGIPSTYASIRFKSVLFIFPCDTRMSPSFCFFSLASFSADTISVFETRPDSIINFFNWSALSCI